MYKEYSTNEIAREMVNVIGREQHFLLLLAHKNSVNITNSTYVYLLIHEK